jgi:hypothetical protein
MFFHFGIAPHLFQLIETSGIGKHYMNNHIYIINDNPLEDLSAFVHIRGLSAFFFYFFFNEIRYGPDLGCTSGFTNYKKIRYCFWYFPEIK